MKKYLFILILLCNVRFSYADIGSGNSFATQNPNTTTSSVTARGFVVNQGGIKFPDGTVQNTAADSAINTLDTTSSTQTKTGGLNLGGSLAVSSITASGIVRVATLTFNSTQIFVSSGNANALGGFSQCFSSGAIPIAANTSIPIGVAGFSQIQPFAVTEARAAGLVATDSIGVVPANWPATTFTVFNSDITNAKQFIWAALCKP